MEQSLNYGSPRLPRKPTVDVTKTQAYREIYAQRLRSYGLLYAKELSGSGSLITDSNENVIRRFRNHKKHRSVSDPNIDLIRTLSIRGSGHFNTKKIDRSSLSDTMLQETLRRRIYSSLETHHACTFSTGGSHRSLLDLRRTEIPEEGAQQSHQLKRHSLIPYISRYIEQGLDRRQSYLNDVRRHSSLGYIDCTESDVFEPVQSHSSDLNGMSGSLDNLQRPRSKFDRSNNPRLREAQNRAQKRYASLKSLEMEIMKADDFIERVKRQCASDKRH